MQLSCVAELCPEVSVTASHLESLVVEQLGGDVQLLGLLRRAGSGWGLGGGAHCVFTV